MQNRAAEYTSNETIHIWVGTFNLNGRTQGLSEDLSPWLCPPVDPSQQHPQIMAVGFQEIVELSPQHIMSTDPNRRQAWESAVKKALNEHARRERSEEYVLLRGGQLVGASLSIFARRSVLQYIKNVEGSLKKVYRNDFCPSAQTLTLYRLACQEWPATKVLLLFVWSMQTHRCAL